MLLALLVPLGPDAAQAVVRNHLLEELLNRRGRKEGRKEHTGVEGGREGKSYLEGWMMGRYFRKLYAGKTKRNRRVDRKISDKWPQDILLEWRLFISYYSKVCLG